MCCSNLGGNHLPLHRLFLCGGRCGMGETWYARASPSLPGCEGQA